MNMHYVSVLYLHCYWHVQYLSVTEAAPQCYQNILHWVELI